MSFILSMDFWDFPDSREARFLRKMIVYFAQQHVIPHWAGGFLSRLQRGRFAYAQKTKPFTGPFQNGLVHSPGRINGNTCRSFLKNSDQFS
jgi:hypothetical protein